MYNDHGDIQCNTNSCIINIFFIDMEEYQKQSNGASRSRTIIDSYVTGTNSDGFSYIFTRNIHILTKKVY